MNRIDEKFGTLLRDGDKALMPYVTAGYPRLALTKSLVLELEEKGADMIELGVPFSDPIADGPTIQKASQVALENGTNLKKILAVVEDIRRDSSLPIALMSYYNPIYGYGLKELVQAAKSVGIDGFIIPDLSPEEAGEFKSYTDKADLDLIFLLAPTSSPHRMKLLTDMTKGFIYCVSLTGVTGARESLSKGLEELVSRIRSITSKPIGVGFGISTPQQAKMVAEWADGVIVGSAIIRLIEKERSEKKLLNSVGNFIKSLKEAMIG